VATGVGGTRRDAYRVAMTSSEPRSGVRCVANAMCKFRLGAAVPR